MSPRVDLTHEQMKEGDKREKMEKLKFRESSQTIKKDGWTDFDVQSEKESKGNCLVVYEITLISWVGGVETKLRQPAVTNSCLNTGKISVPVISLP